MLGCFVVSLSDFVEVKMDSEGVDKVAEKLDREAFKKIASKVQILDAQFHPTENNLIAIGTINGKLKL